MTQATQTRLSTILRRELDAERVSFVPAGEAPEDDATTLTWDLGRGRHLVVAFTEPPPDPEEKRTRLAALVEAFPDHFDEVSAETPRHRPEPAEALKAELAALAGRSGALVAFVIDATSPVVWGASEAPSGTDDPKMEARLCGIFTRAHEAGIAWLELLRRPPTAPMPERKEPEDAVVRPLRLVPRVDELAPLEGADREEISRRAQLARLAITRIRKNPTLAELHRGEHLHEAVREDGLGYLARSFATIYVLGLVFPGPFDELGAERAVIRALPAIERLVVALPPDDSSPTHRAGAVVALRRRSGKRR